MKTGYLYVLVHPSDPDLYKIGITTRNPEQRLAEHNSNYEEYTGQIVKETGQKWELKEFHAVPDPYWAESVFWGTTPFADIPYRYGVEVERMDWGQVQKGLDAARKAGVRPKKELSDYVYANTVWMKKRLEGRGITLVGHVKSKSGKSTFRCINGHEWRTRSSHVGEGEGCPQCGVGNKEPQEIWQDAGLGYLCLLTHPEKPELVKIGVTYSTLEQCFDENVWGDWEVHRYRFVEDPVLAELMIWDLLNIPRSDGREPISIDLRIAENAFRELITRMQRESALSEMKNSDV